MDATSTLPTPTLTDTFIFNFFIISLIFIENKCLSEWCDMRFEKGEKSSDSNFKKHARHWNCCWIIVFF